MHVKIKHARTKKVKKKKKKQKKCIYIIKKIHTQQLTEEI